MCLLCNGRRYDLLGRGLCCKIKKAESSEDAGKEMRGKRWPYWLQINLHKSKSFNESFLRFVFCVSIIQQRAEIGKVLPHACKISCLLGTVSLCSGPCQRIWWMWIWPELGWKRSRIWDIRKDRHLETQMQCESLDIAFYTHLLPWESSWLLGLLGEGTDDIEIL